MLGSIKPKKRDYSMRKFASIIMAFVLGVVMAFVYFSNQEVKRYRVDVPMAYPDENVTVIFTKIEEDEKVKFRITDERGKEGEEFNEPPEGELIALPTLTGYIRFKTGSWCDCWQIKDKIWVCRPSKEHCRKKHDRIVP
jgi:hypothetical protein